MSCMEHWCIRCDWQVFDNKTDWKKCPKCGAMVRSLCDEQQMHSNYQEQYDLEYVEE